MEEFIYIFLAIIWLVISILGSRKKKQQQQQQQQQKPKPQEYQERKSAEAQYETPAQPQRQKEKESGKNLEDLLEEFFGESEPGPKPVEQKAPAPSYTRERTFKDDAKPERRFNEDIEEKQIEKFEGTDAITEDYEFSAEGNVETIEDLIKSYDKKYQKTEEEDKKLFVVDLDEEESLTDDWVFDGKQAIIYSEIIRRKYF